MPVPTAVPPIASCARRGNEASIRWRASATCAAQPPISWLRRTGMASIKVRAAHLDDVVGLGRLALEGGL